MARQLLATVADATAAGNVMVSGSCREPNGCRRQQVEARKESDSEGGDWVRVRARRRRRKRATVTERRHGRR
ncbi:Os05g0405550 [Oryza sativa Japonica Group]|uniref:Os05g0405550 protein n=2 Tax=Oryza TaxID=4527 RepID=A0A0P0WM88_ORYSJ|nr:Os05g0405550 [Oryza sativa Japonica Group]